MTEKFTLYENDIVSTTLPRLQFTQEGFGWRSTVSWNQLPEEIRGLTRLALLKKKVKIWILERRNLEPD